MIIGELCHLQVDYGECFNGIKLSSYVSVDHGDGYVINQSESCPEIEKVSYNKISRNGKGLRVKLQTPIDIAVARLTMSSCACGKDVI